MPTAMLASTKRFIHRTFNRFGYDIVAREPAKPDYPIDFSEKRTHTIKRVSPYTMTSPERISALIDSVTYIVENDIPGDIVECGVWRGGSIMAVLNTLLELGDTQRTIYLYDTFQGMTPPSSRDVNLAGEAAESLFDRSQKRPSTEVDIWCWADIEDVTRNVASTGYPVEMLRFVEGDVLETMPETAPDKISLLRLDTDWYESTRHELVHLYPRLSRSGVLILDDYGHWKGSRAAVDEYFDAQDYKPLLHRIDYSGRCLVKR